MTAVAHGRSTQTSNGHDIDTYAADAATAADALDLRNAILSLLSCALFPALLAAPFRLIFLDIERQFSSPRERFGQRLNGSRCGAADDNICVSRECFDATLRCEATVIPGVLCSRSVADRQENLDGSRETKWSENTRAETRAGLGRLPAGELLLHRSRIAAVRRKNTAPIIQINRRHAIGRLHEIAHRRERRHILCAVSKRHHR
jgi:hypothetical protein